MNFKEMESENFAIAKLKNILLESLLLTKQYKWLIDSYVLDFYIENHWDQLPSSWQTAFSNIPLKNLGCILSDNTSTRISEVLPLSVLAIKILLKKLNILRCIQMNKEQKNSLNMLCSSKSKFFTHPKLKNVFTRQVKAKKQHEIMKMAEVCARVAKECDASYFIDVGSGIGHLARVLAYGYNFEVCCLEQQTILTEQAQFIDGRLEALASKYLTPEEMKKSHKPVHINMKVSKDIDVDDFLTKLRSAFNLSNSEPFSFGIVGLHPCGDLAVTLMNIFDECREAKFINIVGCCYMKLTCDLQSFKGYPVSQYLNSSLQKISALSYESREIACHAIDMYANRLMAEDYDDLKVHAYRATLEKIIVKYWPELKHSGLKSVKNSNSLQFVEYCKKAVAGLNINIPDTDVQSEEIVRCIHDWKKVVIFYSLRLMFAPLIESILLNDRLLSMMEKDYKSEILPAFDPLISPRNHIMIAKKV